MNKNVTIGLATAMLATAMSVSGPATAQALGTCGPANQGQVKTQSTYYPNGKLKHYYEFTCESSQWEMTAHWYCDTRGYCINLS